tara:strand:+ start:58 stop:1449 length:1392 start_codon:yes stop_codon:yes gene_type:complete
MKLNRQKFIRGMALGTGSVAMTPLLEQMEAHAAGRSDGFPRRFVFVVKSSGLTPSGIRPEGIEIGNGDSLLDLNLKDHKLHRSMASLEPFKDEMMILEGLSGCNFQGNHSSYYGAMSCHHSPEKPASATIDCLLGKLNPAPFRNYGFSPNGHSIGNNYGPTVQDTAVFPRISAYGQNKPMPYQASAEKAYRQLFGSALSLETGGKKEFALQANLLDFLKDDANRLAKRISSEEREKLDHYLAAFESVRGRNDKLVAMREKIVNNAPELTTQYASTVFTDRVSVFFDLASAALITGLTNTISIRADWLSVKYATFGFKNTSVHDIGHQKTTDNGMNREQAREVIRKFQIDQIAKLAEKLKAVPEGDGTMLDNTMIIYFSDTGEAHHSQRKEWPFVVIGGRGHKMKTAGRYLRYPQYGKQGHKTIGNWYNTILQANGGEVMDYFGQTDANLKDFDLRGPLSELAI